MKRIGLIGGMSWESTAIYYRLINQSVRARLGGHASADIVLRSLDFAPVELLQRAGDWVGLDAMMAQAAQDVEAAGADVVLLCTNTMHRCADAIEATISIPLLHIAEPLELALDELEIETIGLLGTRYTMEQSFYRERLEEAGIEVLVPEEPDLSEVHRIIYEELVAGRIQESSRKAYKEIMEQLAGDGADAIVLGCTEIGLLVGPDDALVPILDTTILHAQAAVEWALS
ncbi:aspartate racemase [Sphingobium xanthum]|uniref:aspartate/glutamate racemase family protein n=1 Tax=Sphingobium xanthum TaxID=1387165 RepID=UPI001C8BCB46|nr:aspartate/glutamate racemase family protein [Sphingobium xanthum]